MYATKAEINAAIGGYSFIYAQAKSLAEDYATKFSPGWLNEETVEIYEDAETISFETEHSYCGCCSNDIEYHTIPLRYLWEDNWMEQVQTRLDEEKIEREELAVKKEAKRKKERKEARYQSYLAMKEEYEK